MSTRAPSILLVTLSLLISLFGSQPASAANGDRLWVRRYDGLAHKGDVPSASAMSPDGSRMFVTGESYSDETSYDIETIAYEASSGIELWRSRFGSIPGIAEHPNDLVVSPDGRRVFVTGARSWPDIEEHVVTLAYDAASGMLLWGRRSQDPVIQSSGRAIAISSDGGTVFVTGIGTQAGDNVNIRTVAYDAVIGTTEWTRIFDGPGHETDIAAAIAASPDGSHVIVIGQAGLINIDVDWVIISYSATSGALEWLRRIDGPGHAVDIPSSVVESPQGDRVFVAGLLRARTFS